MAMNARKGARPILIAAAATAGLLGWLVTRPDSSTVFVPFPIDAAIDAGPDSSIDAPIDAPPPPSMSIAWTRRAILAEPDTTLTGADGVAAVDVNGDGRLDLTVGWEQSGKSTVSLHPGCGANHAAALALLSSQWPSVTMPVTTSGVEDATFGDVDGDGRQDVVSSGSSGFRVYVHFAPASNGDLLTAAQWTGITITSSINTQRFLKSIVFDFDADGHPDIIAGGYSTGASLDMYTSTTPRTAASWTRTVLGAVGALYSLERRDMDGDGDQDLVITDRDGIGALKGVRWMKNPHIGGGSWTSNSIYQVGLTRWLEVSADGKTIVMGTSNTTGPITTSILTCGQTNPSECNPVGGSAPAWAKVDITQPSNVGQYNAARLADIDGDGDQDIVIVYHHAFGDLSNVIWMSNDGGGTYTRGEISGVDGVKSDNFELYDVDCDGDLDPVTTDEGVRGDATVTPLGLVWYENKFGVL